MFAIAVRAAMKGGKNHDIRDHEIRDRDTRDQAFRAQLQRH
jgi:hypothetical protein